MALVIGNSQYQDAPLDTPTADVEAVAAALEARGFRTRQLKNVESEQLKQAVENFAKSAPTRGTALVYFSGYALRGQDDGRTDTYFVPLGVNVRNDREIGGRGVGAVQLLRELHEQSGSSTGIVLIDGCYRHPQQEDNTAVGVEKPAELPGGSLLCAAAAPGDDLPLPEGKLSSLAERLSKQLRDTKTPLLEALRSASAWSMTSLDSELQLGDATRAIAPPDELRGGTKPGDEWVNGRGMVFCWCPPGTFLMGSPSESPVRDDDEGPVEVTLTRGFWIGKYELTKRECSRNSRNCLASHKNHPIDTIHWDDIRSDLRTLNADERKAGRLPAPWEYALPSEYQWEYAARAGSSTRFYFGDDVSQLPLHANFGDKSLYETADSYYGYAHRQLDDGVIRLARVGTYLPNPWGLHDIYGNLWEWCSNGYVAELPGGADPQIDEKKRGSPVIRGGGWVSRADYCRSAFRQGWQNRAEQNFIGFRYVLQKQPTGAN